jgi:UDP-2,3-diacylglucosamine pyrophosphatase LpxH
MKRIEALYISDVHLGSKGSKANDLLEIMKKYDPEKLFIVGDFIDGWLLKKRHYWPQEHTNIVRKVLSYAKKGTQVYYITGNHDDFLRSYEHLDFGNITVLDEVIDDGIWIVHGDRYDSVVMYNKWIAVLGSIGYEVVIYVNEFVKWCRKKLGLRPRSFSKWVKAKVKGAVAFIDSFEFTLANEAKKRECYTVICGHIHTPADRTIEGVRYMNTGDWIESYSYITKEKGRLILHEKPETHKG